MARFERSRGSRSGSNDGYSRRGNDRNRGGFEESHRNRSSGRDRDSGRGPVEMTRVICSACGDNCEVPFKPTSSKPLYCNSCFSKDSGRDSGRDSGSSYGRDSGRDRKSSNNAGSSRDLDMINEKLNKIMSALDIQ